MRKLLLSIVTLVAIAFGASAASHGVTVSGQVGDYTYVDLGLPSGTKWATYNVGASKPAEYGDYFAWGETSEKEFYNFTNYKFSKDSCLTFTKYVTQNDYGIADSLTTLLTEDDAATTKCGEDWRMPTFAEQQELLNGCTWKWIKDFNGSGVAGCIGTSKTNNNTIFLPAAGYRYGTGLKLAGYGGYYWSSSLIDDLSGSAYDLTFCFDYISDNAHDLTFCSGRIDWSIADSDFGQSVRAVVREK